MRVIGYFTKTGTTGGQNSDAAAVQYPVLADPTVRGAGSSDPQGGAGQVTGEGASSSAGGGGVFGCGAALHEVDNSTCQGGSVNSLSGEFVLTDVDLTRPGRGLGFGFSRAYRSGRTTAGPMGPGWTHSYNTRMNRSSTGDVSVDSGDGQSLKFTKTGTTTFSAPAEARSTMRISDSFWELTQRNQVVSRFNARQCLLARIPNAARRRLSAYLPTSISWLTADMDDMRMAHFLLG
ncbi:DUF6531 domain-containing protein [Vallicoccus soli]|uniref:DUF6531 domain-containing protein n=1 Tax=Vallicoccus soli TaxID=2339232 RepID=UPI00105A95F9|nr:DUF6531 domain-containing protein [Vallicoccus soli]